ncbi:hypothetical protein Tco_1140715, partial [Tanacetum coccineum]
MDKKKKFYLNLETFRDIFQIFPKVHGQDFDELPTDEVIVSFFKELGHTGEIKSITDVVVDQMHQPWRTFATIINRSLSGKTTDLDKLLHADEEPKFAKKKVPVMKTTRKQSLGVALRDTPVMSLSKKKEKVIVDKGKGIKLLSEVALTKEAQVKEVRKKSMRDFYRTHPSDSGKVTKIPPSDAKIKPYVTYEEIGAKLGRDEDDSNNDHDSSSEGSDQENDSGDDITQSDKEKRSDSEQETDKNETGSESDQQENEEEIEDDEEEKEDKVVKTPSNYTPTDDEDETNEESKVKDNAEGDEDKGMDYTTNQFDDVDVRLNDPVHADEGFIQKEGTDAEMINVQQRNENMEITLDQVIEDAHVTISTVAKKTEVPMHKLFLQWMFMSNMKYQAVKHPHSLQYLLRLSLNLRLVSTLEKEVSELRKDDPLRTQVTTLVDEYLDSRIGATRDDFMSYLSVSITARISEQVKIQLPRILLKEVSNFAPLGDPKHEFELKKILIDKMDKSQSYLTATPHRECYDGLIKSYDLDKSLFSFYDKMYSLKRSREDKDKDEDPSARSDRGLKKRKTSKDAEPTKEEPEFKVADSDMPQNQEGNLGNDDEEPIREVASKRKWFTKPKQPQEPTDPDWNVGKTLEQGPTQSWLMTLAATADKPLKTFNELMSTPIDFSAYIMNGLKITNLTQETLLGPAFKLLKGTRTNFAELEYDCEECYKALSEKLDWDNPEGGDYPFDLTKPLSLVMNRNRQIVSVDYFFNNDLKYLQGGILTMTYTTSTTNTKTAQYDLPGIEDMVPNIWSLVKVAYDKHAKWVTQVEVMRKHRYGYPREIEVRRADNELYTFKEGDFPQLRINDIEDILILVIHNRLTNLSDDDVSDFAIALRMFTRSMFSDGTLTRLQTSLDDITKNIHMEYLSQRRWSSLEKKIAHIMINAIDKQLKERRMLRSLEKFVDPLEEGERCQRCTCKWCGNGLREGSCWICPSRDESSSIDALNSLNDLPNVFTHPSQPQYETYSCELCGNDSHHGVLMKIINYSIDHQPQIIQEDQEWISKLNNEFIESVLSMFEEFRKRLQAANISTHTPEPSRRFNSFYDDDDYEESNIPLNEIVSQIPLSIAITPVLPTLEPEDSLIMGNEELSTIPEKESDEVIKSSVEDLVPIQSESEDTFGSDSECDLPSCNDFSPINVFKEKSMTFSNPLFDSNEEFNSSDDESLSDEDILEDNVKIYSRPLFEFDDEYISSDVNPLFDEVLENIESKNSYVSNLYDPVLLVMPLFDVNEDKCFDPGGDIDEINAFLDINISTDIKDGYHDSEGDILYLERLLSDDTTLSLRLKVFLDHDPRSLSDINDMKIMVK